MPRPEPPGDPALRAVEDYLTGLAPAAPELSRDRLLYEAGRRSAGPGRAWPAATLVFAGLAVAMGVRDYTRPEPVPQWVERVVYLPADENPPVGRVESSRPAVSTPTPDGGSRRLDPPYGRPNPPSDDYLRLRDQALRLGVDALPAPPPVRGWSPLPVEGAFATYRAVGATP